MTIWTFLAFALDAIAIAAQALTGRAARCRRRRRHPRDDPADGALGRGQRRGHRAAAGGGQPVVGRLFTGDDAVIDLLVPVLLVAALGQPVAGVVFVLDGVLIGAGDGRYLARAGLVTLVVYAPVALALAAYSAGLVAIWVAFTVASWAPAWWSWYAGPAVTRGW